MACSSCTKRANALTRAIGRGDGAGARKNIGYVGRSISRDVSRIKAAYFGKR